MLTDDEPKQITEYYEQLDRMLVEVSEAIDAQDKRLDELYSLIVLQKAAGSWA